MTCNIVESARKYLGIKWVHQGRHKENGIDCIGLAVLSLRDIGVDVEDVIGYSRVPDGNSLKEILDSQTNLYEVGKPYKFGDIVLLKIKKHPQHIGILTNSKTSNFGLIHSFNGGEKKVIEHDFVGFWSTKVISAYRIK